MKIHYCEPRFLWFSFSDYCKLLPLKKLRILRTYRYKEQDFVSFQVETPDISNFSVDRQDGEKQKKIDRLFKFYLCYFIFYVISKKKKKVQNAWHRHAFTFTNIYQISCKNNCAKESTYLCFHATFYVKSPS